MGLKIKGRCIIKDENGTIILDQCNDIHPGNMARMIARGLAHESNYWINSIKFGDLGTYKNVEGTVVHKTPNDGIVPDYYGWKSDLYHEIYREYLDDYVPTSVSKGSKADYTSDPSSMPNDINGPGVVSVEDGTKTTVFINVILNNNEPNNQLTTGPVFTFDEIALFSGISKSAFSGVQYVDVSKNYDSEDTGLDNDKTYTFDVKLGDDIKTINITTPKIGTGNDAKISYHDLLLLLNDAMQDTTTFINTVAVDVVEFKNNVITPIKL
jgi:hypothetical protein